LSDSVFANSEMVERLSHHHGLRGVAPAEVEWRVALPPGRVLARPVEVLDDELRDAPNAILGFGVRAFDSAPEKSDHDRP